MYYDIRSIVVVCVYIVVNNNRLRVLPEILDEEEVFANVDRPASV